MDDSHFNDKGVLLVRRIIDAGLTPEDQRLIGCIVQRAVDLVAARGLIASEQQLMADQIMHAIDISAVHALHCPLRLWQWLASSNDDFINDYRGIITHINREDGSLVLGWRPVFAKVTIQ